MKSKRNHKTYSFAFKLSVVRACMDRHMSYRAVAKEFGLPDKANVSRWVRAFQASSEAGLRDGRGRNKQRPKRMIPGGLSLEQENSWLRAENAYLKKLLQQERWNTGRETSLK